MVAGVAAWIEYPRPGKDDDFAARAQAWRRDVDALVAALHAGHAQPAPKHPGPTCRGCEQQLFCRLAELAWVDAVDDTDPDGGGVPDETATGDADDAR